MLTKQQKLDIVSKAIDAGATVQMHFHTPEAGGTVTPAEAESILQQRLCQIHDYGYSAVYRGGDHRFEGVIYFPEETPTEWKDTGDVEEVNA